MEDQEAFFKFIDRTVFEDIINSIVSLAVLCDYSISYIHSHIYLSGEIKKIEDEWGLTLHGEDKNYTIRFRYSDYRSYRFALDENCRNYNEPFNDVNAADFLVMLNLLLNKI